MKQATTLVFVLSMLALAFSYGHGLSVENLSDRDETADPNSQLDSNVGCFKKVASQDLWICGYGWAMGSSNSSMRAMPQEAGPQEPCPCCSANSLANYWEWFYMPKDQRWKSSWGRTDNETFPIIQSSEEHLMERATKVGNVDVINYVIGYNNTDTGLATVCVAPNHLLTLVNINDNPTLLDSLMSVLAPTWTNEEGDVELSARLCCTLTGTCDLGVWDLKTKEIWNDESNMLALLPGGEDI